jgi:GntR family transcriptional regulator, galactonate operon transcriptional repressor
MSDNKVRMDPIITQATMALDGLEAHAVSPLEGAQGQHLTHRIADELGRRIVANIYPVGSVLPTELELCQTLAVSRPALREAIQMLATRGLIISRRKTGTLVRPRTAWNMLDAEVLAWHLRALPSDAFVKDLFELRKIVEPAASALAAERRSDEQAERLATALTDLVRFQDGSGDIMAADLRFHRAILEAANNHFLASFGALIGSSLLASFQLTWTARLRTPDYALQQHKDVLDAIRNRKAEAAHAAMQQLLVSAIADVEEALRQRQRGAHP